MPNYLLAIYQPDDTVPEPAMLERVMEQLDEINSDIRAAGAWVFAGGLHPASTATVLQSGRDGDMLVTDGPYTEGKEHLGGFTIVAAPDLDAALAWGSRIAAATTLPVEVRPFQDPAGA
jgi:hypothetical protein